MEHPDDLGKKFQPLSARRAQRAAAYSAGWASPKKYQEKGADGKMHGREVLVRSTVELERKSDNMIGVKSGDGKSTELTMRREGLIMADEHGKVMGMQNNRNSKQGASLLKTKSAIGGVEVGDDPFQIQRPGGSKQIPANRAMNAYNGWVYAGVSAIAMDMATIQWRLFQVNASDSHEEIFEHELLDLLEGVNEFQTGVELRFLMGAHLELAGNAYLLKLNKNKEPVKTDTEKPVMLYPLNPGGITMRFDKSKFPYVLTNYVFQYDGKKHNYEPHQILHLKYPDPNDMWSGIGAIQAIAAWIDVANYQDEYNRRFFINGAHIDGILQSEMTAEETIDVLRTSWETSQAGVENAHKTPVLPKGVKYVQTSASPKDMDFSNLDDRARDKILAGLKVSKTILGTAESDTNRATAETADYVFAKRTIRPKMELICAYLNEFLVPLFGDKIYISYENPVPEDAEFRIKELQAVTASSPVLSVNEARENYMGLGPVEGGDTVQKLNNLEDLGAPRERSTGGGGGNDKEDDDENKDDDKEDEEGEEGKMLKKTAFPRGVVKRHVGRNITRGAQNAKFKQSIGQLLAERVSQALAADSVEDAEKKRKREHINELSHEEYDSIYKDFLSRVDPFEKKIKDLLIAINHKQKDEVMKNLESATGVEKEKAVQPEKLFDLKKWITITINALTPVLTDLGNQEGAAAADLVSTPLPGSVFDSPEAKSALDQAVSLMAQSYNESVLNSLSSKLDEGIRNGFSYQQLADSVSDIYEFQDENAALRVARTESVRIANMSTKAAWKATGVVKTVKWYTAMDDKVCPYCQAENGTEININDNFYNIGDEVGGETDDTPAYSNDYSDIGGPPLHPLCRCYIRPEVISTN